MTLAPGSHLGPYEILSLLGAGGMGEVYKARDPRLRRDVAIKVLPRAFLTNPERLRRFEDEARAAAALNHPNILAVYDIGEQEGSPFIVSELLEGDTLERYLNRKPLPSRELLDFAIQATDALDAAHEKGLIHRDLKPSNIFITRRGALKLLDFGLAKILRFEPFDTNLKDTHLLSSPSGAVVGTVPYMSPEQARGEPVDARSDIYSLGAVVYEMATGRAPFIGNTSAILFEAILNRKAAVPSRVNPHLSCELDQIIERCLEKAPAHRYDHARELMAALRMLSQQSQLGAVAHRGENTEPSIAVLPFANVSSDPENIYFSDGLAEELITALAKLPGLHVASRTSAFRFRGGSTNIQQVGRDLHVMAVVEGSVRRAGDRLRVTAQLTSVEDGYCLWSERYDRAMANVFEMHDEIVEAICKALSPALLGKTSRRRPTDNLEAYELYLKGRYYWHQRSPSTLQMAIRLFERVIELDPNYALAYAGLADCLSIYRAWGWFSAAQTEPRARAAVMRAVELDSSLAEVNFSHALYTYWLTPNWRDAIVQFERAIAIDSRFGAAHAYLGMCKALDGRTDEAAAQVNIARQIDPLSPFIHFMASIALNICGRCEDGERAARHSLNLQPDTLMGLWQLTNALIGQGKIIEAVSTAERLVTISRESLCLGVLGFVYGRAGRVKDANRLFNELAERALRGEYIFPTADLMIQLGLGNVAGIRRALEACVVDKTPTAPFANLRSIFESFRTDSEIDRLLGEVFGGSCPTVG